MELGLSSCGKPINEDTFRSYTENEIKHMEISPRSTEYDDFDYKSAEKLAKQFGINLWSYHLQFSPFIKTDISSPNEELRQSTLNILTEQIKKAADIGIDKFILHASGEPISDEQRPLHMEKAKESLIVLAEVANTSGGVIAVEDLPRSCLGNCSDDILELISVDDRLRVCFDTNHLLKQDNCEFIKAVGHKLISTHVSDYDFMNERHWLPGEGKIDWQALIGTLLEVNYTGVWLYEMGFACPKTIYRDRSLTCEDFARNYKELFEGKAPTVFSTQKENLGMWE